MIVYGFLRYNIILYIKIYLYFCEKKIIIVFWFLFLNLLIMMVERIWIDNGKFCFIVNIIVLVNDMFYFIYFILGYKC